MRLQFTQIDFNDLIKIGFWIRVNLCVSGEVLADTVGHFRDICAACGTQVPLHAIVVPECRCRRSNFRPHVADCAFARAAQRLSSFAKIFHDATCATFHGEHACNLQNNVLGGSPTRKFSGEFDSDQFGKLQFPWHTRHDINRICSANTYSNHAQSTRIDRV